MDIKQDTNSTKFEDRIRPQDRNRIWIQRKHPNPEPGLKHYTYVEFIEGFGTETEQRSSMEAESEQVPLYFPL